VSPARAETRQRRWAWSAIALAVATVPSAYLIGATRRPMVEKLTPLPSALPAAVGGWRQVTSDLAPVDPTDRGEGLGLNDVYDAVENRAYANAAGDQIMVTLAYRRIQRPESKIHRPELCYYAQGYAISGNRPVMISGPNGTIAARTFEAQGQARGETVVYWIRIGDETPSSAWATRLLLFRAGLRGLAPDGILVRASMIGDRLSARGQSRHVQVLRAFLTQLTGAASPAGRRLLVGAPRASGTCGPGMSCNAGRSTYAQL